MTKVMKLKKRSTRGLSERIQSIRKELSLMKVTKCKKDINKTIKQNKKKLQAKRLI